MIATVIALAVGLVYFVPIFLHPNDPGYTITLAVLSSELAAGTFAGASMAWSAFTRDALKSQVRIGVAIFVLVTVVSWIVTLFQELAGILLPLEVYPVLAVILVLVACRRDFSQTGQIERVF